MKKYQKIYDRIRTGQWVYILNRRDYYFSPILKRIKVVGKRYIDFGHCKVFYLVCGNRVKIEINRQEIYTSKRKARSAYLSAYKTHIKKRSQTLNKIKSSIVKLEKEIVAKKYNLRRLETK